MKLMGGFPELTFIPNIHNLICSVHQFPLSADQIEAFKPQMLHMCCNLDSVRFDSFKLV